MKITSTQNRELHIAGTLRGLKPLPSNFEGTAVVRGELGSLDCEIFDNKKTLVGHGTNWCDGKGWYVWAI
jgi:hypothetical protein